MQSSQHILQESVKGMRDELKDCYVRIKDYEFKEEEWKQTKEKMENFKVSLTYLEVDISLQSILPRSASWMK